MARRLHHRGPDGYGIWADDHVGLAHTRLSVIDISDAGAQPMHDDRGDVHIVFNGEIYNFLPLRAELEARGHRYLATGNKNRIMRCKDCGKAYTLTQTAYEKLEEQD